MELKKPKKKIPRRQFDSAWKEVIENLFKEMLEFLFPKIYEVIDFEKKIEFLNTELRHIAPGSASGDRAADVLVKAHLKDGTHRYFLIYAHLEVQGPPSEDLMRRMYIYNYRIFDKKLGEDIVVISMAILIDNNENYRPAEYSVDFCGFELRMKVPIVKILDFNLKKELREKLEISNNPIAIVIKAQLKSMELNKADDDSKFEMNKELIRECYKRNYSKDYTRVLLKFIERITQPSKTLQERLYQEIQNIEEEFKMPYLSSWERRARKEGLQKGRQEGLQQGLQEGLQEGLQQGLQQGMQNGMHAGSLEARRDNAKRMLLDGMPIEKIKKYTGLTEEQIRSLMH